jgi:GAF domain-containing protein
MADDPRVLELVEQYIRRQDIIRQAYGLLNNPGRVGAADHVASAIDQQTQDRLDTICSEVCTMLEVPLAAITLINADKQLVLGACGMSHEPMDRDHSFCIFVASSGTAFQLSDLGDADLTCLPAYTEKNIRAYLGRPLNVRDQPVGALCAVDFEPREWSDIEHSLLTSYAAHISAILEERA